MQSKTRVRFAINISFAIIKGFVIYYRFILLERVREINLECVSQQDKLKLNKDDNRHPADTSKSESGETAPKKQRISKKEKLRGQNKSRGPTFKRDQGKELCNVFINLSDTDPTPQCQRKDCAFLHDTAEYLKIKPKDIGV